MYTEYFVQTCTKVSYLFLLILKINLVLIKIMSVSMQLNN